MSANLNVHLDVAGQGEELTICTAEAERLGVSRQITFHGQVSREEVERLYAKADVFIFPSFREPSGSVVFEAMRHGLPVVTTERGGPGFVIDESCGIKVPAVYPEQLATDLASAITHLALDPSLVLRLSQGAHERVAKIGLWHNKIEWLLTLYSQILEADQYTDLKEAI